MTAPSQEAMEIAYAVDLNNLSETAAAIDRRVLAERERCARICEYTVFKIDASVSIRKQIAAAIRAQPDPASEPTAKGD